ncbi:hypothetical protein [Nonomuraea helvata]|uniref:DJ-1/PfpI domain-containing protein n=1 Tax=Nonomuraea helvata TaxID=37484 RepID=A0ABV5S6P2_9ACTN
MTGRSVYLPGGHGPMEDLCVDADAGRLLTEALASGKPLALVCHAPAAMLATRIHGVSPFAGYTARPRHASTARAPPQRRLADAPLLRGRRLTEAAAGRQRQVDDLAPDRPVGLAGAVEVGFFPADQRQRGR